MGALCLLVLFCFGISVHALTQGVTLFSDLGVILLIFFLLLGMLFSLHIYVECKEHLIFHTDYIKLQKPDQTWTIPVDTIRALWYQPDRYGMRRLTFILTNGGRRWIICTKSMQHTIENRLMNINMTEEHEDEQVADATILPIKPPIVLNAGGDVSFCCSKETAELDMEPIDVRNGYYIAYDSEGRRLTIDIIEKEVKLFWGFDRAMVEHTVITGAPDEPVHQEELRLLLVDYFELLGMDPDWLQHALLEQLIQKGIEVFKLAGR
jgi:hypothetical protein